MSENQQILRKSRSALRDSEKINVSIIIVTYNSAEQIRDCLTSATKEKGSLKQEIIVVDNDSQDETVNIIRNEFPEVRLFLPGENLGFAKACNFAANQSPAQYYLLLNPDTVVLDRAVERVVKFANENPEFGFYGGKTLKADGKTLEPSSCWDQPSLWSQFTFATGLSTLFKRNAFFDSESIGSWQRNTIREVGVITGCFLLVERNAWNKINGFDEHYWIYGEDVDLAYRARKAGFRPVIFPSAVVVHEVGQSSTSSQKIVWLFRGKVSVINKQFSRVTIPIAIALLKFGVLLRALPNLIKNNTSNKWVAAWNQRIEWHKGHPEE